MSKGNKLVTKKELIRILELRTRELQRETQNKLNKFLYPKRDINMKCPICGAEANELCIYIDPIESIVFSDLKCGKNA